MNFFHVTLASSVSRILHSGIRTGKTPIWFKKGTGLFPPGFIFAFTDYREAAKWAFKQTVHTSKNTVIITFTSEPINWIEDENPENILDCLGKWIKSDIIVLPGEILEVACQAQWEIQIEGTHAKLDPQEKMNAWKRFYTHFSAISQFLILPGNESEKK